MGSVAGPQHLAWPQDLLAQVLQHVPQQQRLTSCAFVSRSWRTATVAATTSVDVPRSDDTSTPAISSWLLQHGSNLHSLSVARNREDSWAYFREPPVLLLPFQQLRQLKHLDLQQLVVQQYQAGGELQDGSWADLAMLTSICLHQVNLQTQGTYAALSALTTLQSLQVLSPLTASGRHHFSSQQIVIELAPLSQLTRLAVNDLVEASMSALGNLRLAELMLSPPPPEPCIFQHLPMTLSKLEMYGGVSGAGNQLIVSASSTPRLMELTGLQHLRLTAFKMEPSVLSSLVELTHLDMGYVTLVPEGNIGTRAFLGILPCFMKLRHLSYLLRNLEAHEHDALEPEAFASLLSSTNLTYLDISGCELPGSVVQHMFQVQQPLLQVLTMWLKNDRTYPINTHDDLQDVVHCCPSLQELSLVHAIKWDVRLTTLAQLSNLTSLTLGGGRMQSAPAIEDIVSSGLQVTLKQLTLSYIHDLSPRTLLSLRQLTKLTRLDFSACGYRKEEIGQFDLRGFKLCSKADPPDVWQQLEDACLQNGIGADVLLKERIAESHCTIASLQQQLREEQQLRVACEQRASQMQQMLEQQVQHLRHQLEESQPSNLALHQQLQQSHHHPEVAQNFSIQEHD